MLSSNIRSPRIASGVAPDEVDFTKAEVVPVTRLIYRWIDTMSKSEGIVYGMSVQSHIQRHVAPHKPSRNGPSPQWPKSSKLWISGLNCHNRDSGVQAMMYFIQCPRCSSLECTPKDNASKRQTRHNLIRIRDDATDPWPLLTVIVQVPVRNWGILLHPTASSR